MVLQAKNDLEYDEDGKMETSTFGQSTSRKGSISTSTLLPCASVEDRASTKPSTQRCSVTANGDDRPAARRVRRTRGQQGVCGSWQTAIPRWNSVDEMFVAVRGSVDVGRSDRPALPTAEGALATSFHTSPGNHVEANNADGRSLWPDDKVEVRQGRPGIESREPTANKLNVSATVNHVDKNAPIVTKTPENSQQDTAKSTKV